MVKMNEEKQYCYKYPHPSITADCVIFGYDVKDGLSLLLIERKAEPFKGRWAFPGGFMHIDEDTESCARRELQEETALVLTSSLKKHAFYNLLINNILYLCVT